MWHSETNPDEDSGVDMWLYGTERDSETDIEYFARTYRALRISFWMHSARCRLNHSLVAFGLTRPGLVKEAVAFFFRFANDIQGEKGEKCSHFPAIVCPPFSWHILPYLLHRLAPPSPPPFSCDSRRPFRWLGFCSSGLETN